MSVSGGKRAKVKIIFGTLFGRRVIYFDFLNFISAIQV